MSNHLSNFIDKNPALRIREFQYYLLIRFFVVFALFMQISTLLFWIYQHTHSELKLGYVGLAEFIPAVLMSLVSGYLVDKYEKKSMLLFCIICYTFLSLGLYLLTSQHTIASVGLDLTLTLIYVLLFFGGIIRAFLSPSSFALFGLLIRQEHYTNAATWSSMAWQLGSILGPLVSGIAIALYSPSTSMILVFIFLLFALFSISRVKKKPIFEKSYKESMFKSIGEGLRFVRNSPVLLGALILDLFSVFFGGAMALLPVFQEEILKVGEAEYGIMRAAPGIGAMITMIIITLIPIKSHPGGKLFLFVGLYGLSIILFGFSTNIYFSVLMLIFSGLFDAVSVVIRGVILQLVTPNDMRGRIASVNTMFISSSNELGDFESGVMSHWYGPARAVVIGGCLSMAVVITTFWRFPRLRKFKYESTNSE